MEGVSCGGGPDIMVGSSLVIRQIYLETPAIETVQNNRNVHNRQDNTASPLFSDPPLGRRRLASSVGIRWRKTSEVGLGPRFGCGQPLWFVDVFQLQVVVMNRSTCR